MRKITKLLLCLQIEREKADLSVQVIQLSERLEEAEGGAESQVNILFQTIIIKPAITNKMCES